MRLVFQLKKPLQTASLLLMLAAITACQTTAKPSGFLTSYKDFRAGPEGGVERIWSHPDIRSEKSFKDKLSPYSAVILDPIWVSFSNQETYDGVAPEELQNLVSLFKQELKRAMGKEFPIVSKPGANVLRISIGLTGLESPSRILAATSTFMPVGLGISTVSKLVTGEHTNVGSASMELVATDSITGVSLFAAIDRRVGGKNLKKIADPLSDAKDAFKWWAERLRHTLQRSR
jgi:hypothetical protein